MTPHIRRGLRWALGLGFGLGLMAGGALWLLLGRPAPTDEQIIARARTLGMTRATELPGTKVTVLVKPETTLADLAAMLKAAGLIAETDAFAARAEARQGRPKAGLHVITAGQPLDELVTLLVTAP